MAARTKVRAADSGGIMQVGFLVHGRKGYLVRVYSPGWDANLAGWAEEVADSFDEICQLAEDDATECKLVGEAKWMWLRLGRTGRAIVREDEFPNAMQVTMIRVHRSKRKSEK